MILHQAALLLFKVCCVAFRSSFSNSYNQYAVNLSKFKTLFVQISDFRKSTGALLRVNLMTDYAVAKAKRNTAQMRNFQPLAFQNLVRTIEGNQ